MRQAQMATVEITNMSGAAPHRPLSFKAGHAIQAFALSFLVYGFSLGFAFLLSRMGTSDQVTLAFAHTASAMAFLTCWRLGRWGRARHDSFGAALLLVAVAFRVIALIDTLAFGTRAEEMYRYWTLPVSDPVIELLLKGEFITTTGILLVASSWRLGIGERIEQFSFVANGRQVPIKLALGVYLAAILIEVSTRILSIGFGPFEQLTKLLYGFGVASIFFIGAYGRTRILQVAIAGLLALPLFVLALRSGVKEEMFFPLVPAALLFWTRFNNVAARGLILVLGIALLAIAQLYVHYVRDTTWKSAGVVETSTGELISGFGNRADGVQANDALDSISSRVNMTIAHATTVTLADNRGHEPVEVFGMIPASMIPRVLWPGKPIMQPGAMHTSRILGGMIPVSQIGSATAAGFATELYLGGWWLGVVLGGVIYGLLLAWAQKWTWRNAPGFGHQALCFVVLYWTIRFDEKAVVYAYTSILFTVVFVWMLNQVARSLGFNHRVRSFSARP